MSLVILESVQKLQTALHAKAKGDPKFRFYSLYDKIYRQDVLWTAYRRCLANDGSPGVDGQTFDDIKVYGEMKWMEELAEELRKKTYQPQPVRRVYIPKPDGKQRPLGIPTIKDRVVQTAALIVLEPIFEADLQPEQYAYRADRSALARGARGAEAIASRLYGGGGRGPVGLLRFDPTRRADAVRRPAGVRRGDVASGKDVARRAGRGEGRQGPRAPHHSQQRRWPGNSARSSGIAAACELVHAAFRAGMEKNWDTSRSFALESSIMPTTS
jgi:hypothetical protein